MESFHFHPDFLVAMVVQARFRPAHEHELLVAPSFLVFSCFYAVQVTYANNGLQWTLCSEHVVAVRDRANVQPP